MLRLTETTIFLDHGCSHIYSIFVNRNIRPLCVEYCLNGKFYKYTIPLGLKKEPQRPWRPSNGGGNNQLVGADLCVCPLIQNTPSPLTLSPKGRGSCFLGIGSINM